MKKSTGIIAIKLNENDSIANVLLMNEENMIIVTKKGMSIYFETKGINPIGRTSMGVKAIKLNEDDEVITGIPIYDTNLNLAIFTSGGLGKKMKMSDFTIQNRAGKGVSIYKNSITSDNLVGATILSNDDNILLIGKPNSICISSNDIPLLTKAGMGNIMIKNSKISKIVKL